MNERVAELRAALRLEPHPEGGFFREHYRGELATSTAIYYLLCEGAWSAWHRVDKDELWHHYEGGPIALHVLIESQPADLAYRVLRLGPLDAAGQRPSQLVPAGAWQAARLEVPGSYALVGNTVAPGFELVDWTLADAATLRDLAARYPSARAALAAFGAASGTR